MFSALGGELGMEPVADQGVGVWAGDDEDRTAVAAVAAARPSARDELFAAEGKATPAAVSGRHVNVNFVDEQLLDYSIT